MNWNKQVRAAESESVKASSCYLCGDDKTITKPIAATTKTTKATQKKNEKNAQCFYA